MLLRPVEIDLAGGHRLEGALHTERADVDVGDDNRNEQDGDHGMHDLCDLHPRDISHIERENQQTTRNNDRRSSAKRKPKHQLFAGIETPRRRMFRSDEAAALLDPVDVDLSREVVLYPECYNKREAED